MKRLIIFDTGTGGKIFAAHLRAALPSLKIIEVIDEKHSPYGEKSPEEITNLTEKALTPYLNNPKNLIFLACNTATAYALEPLRKKYPEMTFIGTEPMLRPAATATKTHIILVLATPVTLKSPRYKALKSNYAANETILEPDCSLWAAAIDAETFDTSLLTQTLSLSAHPDVIVLACTHYLKIAPEIAKLFPAAKILSPLVPITNRIKVLLRPE
jgi:glutamate racemase